MFDIIKFIYDLTATSVPSEADLCDEVDRILFIEGAEQATYLLKQDDPQMATKILDAEVVNHWIKRRFEPALISLLITGDDNKSVAAAEVSKMGSSRTLVDRLLRFKFVERYAQLRSEMLAFDNLNKAKATPAIERLKRMLTFLSNHLQANCPQNLTLLNTDAYSVADITLYKYLKRILVGQYKDFGLKSHVKLNENLVKFMKRYAEKNTYVLDVTDQDPLADQNQDTSLLQDMTKPAMIFMGFILFYLWRTRTY